MRCSPRASPPAQPMRITFATQEAASSFCRPACLKYQVSAARTRGGSQARSRKAVHGTWNTGAATPCGKRCVSGPLSFLLPHSCPVSSLTAKCVHGHSFARLEQDNHPFLCLRRPPCQPQRRHTFIHSPGSVGGGPALFVCLLAPRSVSFPGPHVKKHAPPTIGSPFPPLASSA